MTDPRTETLDQTAAPFRPLPVRLLVLAGPDLGKEFVLEQGTALVGTHTDCSLQLTDGAISRRHLSIELMGVRARVRDLSSKNGTRFQGAKVTVLEVHEPDPGNREVYDRLNAAYPSIYKQNKSIHRRLNKHDS